MLIDRKRTDRSRIDGALDWPLDRQASTDTSTSVVTTAKGRCPVGGSSALEIDTTSNLYAHVDGPGVGDDLGYAPLVTSLTICDSAAANWFA